MIKVFFSYSHKDEELRDELDAHLAPLRKTKIIETWHDRVIDAGEEFDHEIDSNLADSNIILLLVSSNFLNSDYCYDIEMKEALTMHQSGVASVIPIILRSCDWQITPLGKLNACPTDGKPITSYKDFHEAYTDVAKSIRKVAENIRSKPLSVTNKLETLSSRHEKISDESNKLKEQIKQEKSLHTSRHKELIDWLAQNNESYVSKIYSYIVDYHRHLELSYKVPLEPAEKRIVNRNISHFIERLETSLIEDRTKALDEPGFEIPFNKNIYKLAFEFLLGKVPPSVSTESKDTFKSNIDYLLTRI